MHYYLCFVRMESSQPNTVLCNTAGRCAEGMQRAYVCVCVCLSWMKYAQKSFSITRSFHTVRKSDLASHPDSYFDEI